ncbi:LOW QUALITY PROTEIN: glutamate receptor 1.4 [Lactuca sativa]|uniref:LOW QUALITY PROTEIN: glutamate receptor 1.4 n=1 Tax=Lactuca sativa TaxID=4236 RepID=UPI0022AE79D8|nr:LOW QUALITY PROTEIN: glutamate receptor 1.4 [Lactuca sativa]
MKISSRERTHLSSLMLMLLCLQIYTKAQEDLAYKEIPVGVILDMGSSYSYSYSGVGKAVHSCITMAVSEFYMVNPHFQTRIILHHRDTHGDPLHALSAALDLLEKPKVEAIIGSESTAEAKLLAVLGDKARVPILSLSPCLSCNKHPYFLQVAHDETTQFKGIAAMAESFRWKEVTVICEDSENGRDMTTFMTNTFQKKGIIATHWSLISTSSSNELLQEEVHKLLSMQTKIFIMHASPSLASRILVNAKYLGMMDEGYKWVITSKTMDFLNLMDDEVIESMQGAVGFKSYVPQLRDIHKFTSRWRKEYDHAKNHVMVKLKEINTYDIWAYDAVSALAMAVERIQADELKIKEDLETSGLTEKGRTLLNQMLSNRKMNGAQVMEIINVIDKGEKRVGFWRRDAGFTKKIGELKSFADEGLEAIIWPRGVSVTTNSMHNRRRMLLLQVNKEILRIGVPPKFKPNGVFQVKHVLKLIQQSFQGFVFQTAFTALDLNVSLQFIPFMDAYRNYNNLLHRVYTGEFDAAVGDITITANRSRYVDFTLPFTDLGIGLLSRNTDPSMWIFMKPLSSDLWLVSACFFILLGFVIWILEHRSNEEFQGSPSEQIGTTLWFAFSTLVYAHRQKLKSNLSRFVVTVWLFVVLVLASSYTATLSSLLTIEQIRLASNRDIIVSNLIGNKDRFLLPFSTSEDYADALSHGSKNGGVDAILDEIPYLKEFLVQYPSGYSMAVYEMITNGFGFVSVFPTLTLPFIYSPLVPELSREISRLREDGTLKMLDNKWFKSNSQSMDSEPVLKILNLKECRGLFLISGVSMTLALFIFLLYFIHDKLYFTYTMLFGGKLAFIMRILNPKTGGRN